MLKSFDAGFGQARHREGPQQLKALSYASFEPRMVLTNAVPYPIGGVPQILEPPILQVFTAQNPTEGCPSLNQGLDANDSANPVTDCGDNEGPGEPDNPSAVDFDWSLLGTANGGSTPFVQPPGTNPSGNPAGLSRTPQSPLNADANLYLNGSRFDQVTRASAWTSSTRSTGANAPSINLTLSPNPTSDFPDPDTFNTRMLTIRKSENTLPSSPFRSISLLAISHDSLAIRNSLSTHVSIPRDTYFSNYDQQPSRDWLAQVESRLPDVAQLGSQMRMGLSDQRIQHVPTPALNDAFPEQHDHRQPSYLVSRPELQALNSSATNVAGSALLLEQVRPLPQGNAVTPDFRQISKLGNSQWGNRSLTGVFLSSRTQDDLTEMEPGMEPIASANLFHSSYRTFYHYCCASAAIYFAILSSNQAPAKPLKRTYVSESSRF